jgi:pimeloyl-ACP methyl ester carboxylesterase
MGGYVAFRLVAGWPERIAALVLADTRAGADDEAGAAKRLAQEERARREGIEWLPDAMTPVLLGETTRRERPQLVRVVHEMILRADPEGVARALLAMRTRPDSMGLLKDIGVPVLALAGTEDTITPVSEARTIAEGVPNGTLAEIVGAGHLSNLENPAAFWAVVGPFLGAS